MTRLKNNLHQGCTNSEQRFTRAVFFFRWRLIFAGLQCGTCFMSQFLRLELYGIAYIFEKLVHSSRTSQLKTLYSDGIN